MIDLPSPCGAYGARAFDDDAGPLTGFELLLDAKRRAGDVDYEVRGAPEAEAQRRRKLAEQSYSAPSALHDELIDPNLTSVDWHEQHTPGIVASTRVLARHNKELGDQKLGEIVREIAPLQERGAWPHRAAAWERLHRFDLEVKVTDPKYAAHLFAGHEFGTTAFDVWMER